MARGEQAPFLEEGEDGSGLRLNPGTASTESKSGGGREMADAFVRVSPLVATKTVLLVKGTPTGAVIQLFYTI